MVIIWTPFKKKSSQFFSWLTVFNSNPRELLAYTFSISIASCSTIEGIDMLSWITIPRPGVHNNWPKLVFHVTVFGRLQIVHLFAAVQLQHSCTTFSVLAKAWIRCISRPLKLDWETLSYWLSSLLPLIQHLKAFLSFIFFFFLLTL